MGIARLIKAISGKGTSVVNFVYYFNKEILCSGNSDADHVSDEALNSFDEQIKIRLRSK